MTNFSKLSSQCEYIQPSCMWSQLRLIGDTRARNYKFKVQRSTAMSWREKMALSEFLCSSVDRKYSLKHTTCYFYISGVLLSFSIGWVEAKWQLKTFLLCCYFTKYWKNVNNTFSCYGSWICASTQATIECNFFKHNFLSLCAFWLLQYLFRGLCSLVLLFQKNIYFINE